MRAIGQTLLRHFCTLPVEGVEFTQSIYCTYMLVFFIVNKLAFYKVKDLCVSVIGKQTQAERSISWQPSEEGKRFISILPRNTYLISIADGLFSWKLKCKGGMSSCNSDILICTSQNISHG